MLMCLPVSLNLNPIMKAIENEELEFKKNSILEIRELYLTERDTAKLNYELMQELHKVVPPSKKEKETLKKINTLNPLLDELVNILDASIATFMNLDSNNIIEEIMLKEEADIILQRMQEYYINLFKWDGFIAGLLKKTFKKVM